MAAKVRPRLVFADASGNIYDHPSLLMLCRRGGEIGTPRPDELIVLPEESDVFLLPGRRAMGLDPDTGELEVSDPGIHAVAAFASPGHTLAATTAYVTDGDVPGGPPVLPLFAYGAVGYENGRFYIAAKKVDEDRRQVFANIATERIQAGAREWLKRFPKNRLVQHLAGCALTSCCPAARNLCLGRFEAPLPTARACNARCVGCISLQPEDSGFPSTQNRISFTPTANEIVEIMQRHAEREKKPIFSFGQGCEGEPLTEGERIAEAVRHFRKQGGQGTVNINTNGSLTRHIAPLAEAGVDAIRVSLNSVRPELYTAYYRPASYAFDDVEATIAEAKGRGMWVSLNFLYFPGISDTEPELEALIRLVSEYKVDLIQLRNLNLDPELYMDLAGVPFSGPDAGLSPLGPAMGLNNFRKRLRKACDWLSFGYFNPYLGPKG